MMDLEKEGSLDQDDLEKALQLIKNMKRSALRKDLGAHETPDLPDRERAELALLLETLDEFTEGDDNIISPEEFYSTLTFEKPLALRNSMMQSKLNSYQTPHHEEHKF